LKRALKKKMKAVLETTINNDASIAHSSLVTPQVKRRMPKAAMIGLAISMGATSLFVTRQSDQALAAEPVGNQNTASTIPAASN
jgi:ABC-type enterobactin transport system permease subunit